MFVKGWERKYIKNYEANIALLIDYTIIRAQWFSNADEIDYELTQKGEAFKNPSGRISCKSIADLIVKLCTIKNFGIRQSLGINKPLK
ncbi:NAD(P)H-binding protein [Helicobacter sp. UBA3407]|uniref:NAD(P)H-binding protein n=1 Tax=Helicobacter TaxID=209 RepID=UPI002601656D|nr:NAD(P)H-binding protein [Helicobacter sp. UBA3407]